MGPTTQFCDAPLLYSRIKSLSAHYGMKSAPNNDAYPLHLCSIVQDYICALVNETQLATGNISSSEPGSLSAARPSHIEIWCYGLLAVCTVCSCAAFGICLYPIMKKDIFQHILTWMIGLAVGCLSGVAILHLIPQAYELDAEHYLHKSLGIMAAIYFFFLSERILRFSVQYRKENKEKVKLISIRERTSLPLLNCNHHPAHEDLASTTVTDQNHTGHALNVPTVCLDRTSVCRSRRPSGAIHVHDIFQPTEAQLREQNGFDKTAQASADSVHPDHARTSTSAHAENPHVHLHGQCDSGQSLKTVAWMILTGDGVHKFVDGLSIGAAFSMSILRGISISLAVMCEELPHELGDFAILLNTGLSLKRAILYNCLSGLPCFFGICCWSVFWVNYLRPAVGFFALAAGMFIYISYVNMLPEMTIAVETASQHSVKDGMKVFLIQNFGLLFGILLTYLLAQFADKISLE